MMKKTQSISIWFLPLIIFGGIIFPVLGNLVLGMMIFIIVFSFFKNRFWCSNLCPRGAFLDILIAKISKNKPMPKFLFNPWFKLLVFVFFISFVTFQLILAKGVWLKIGWVFVLMCIVTTIIATIIGIMTKHRCWCIICPIGFLQEKIFMLNKRRSK